MAAAMGAICGDPDLGLEVLRNSTAKDVEKAEKWVKEERVTIYCDPDSIVSQSNMALIAVVGRGMIHTKGISAKVFTALSSAGVNIRMISQGSSELNIIIGIENSDFDQAIKAIYQAFA